MILQTRRGGNVELRTGEWGTSHIIPSPGSVYMSDAGMSISELDAYGLPAVSNVIRSAASLVGSLPFFVYRDDADVRQPARDAWQWGLLHDFPSDNLSSFDFFYDLALSIEATQNAFVQKIRGVGSQRGRLIALEIIDPHRVNVQTDRLTGEKTFDVWVAPGNIRRGLTSRDILHVRGFTPSPGGNCGVSLIQLHANVLGAHRAQQKFEGDYFKNKGIPPFWFTGAANQRHGKEIKEGYMANRLRAEAGEPGYLWGEVDVKSLPISMQDAAYIENKKLSVDDVCRIWQWPKEMLEASGGQQVPEEWWDERFLKFYVLPRLRRIERAFASDPDIFPANAGLFGEFLTTALERASFVTRVRGYKDARQGGWVTANEIRKWENLPPIDGGDELQVTPVGGAPNPASDSGGAAAEPDNEEPNDDD